MSPSNLTIRQLEIFLAASRAESFSAAAISLGIAQPSLSSVILKMERQLGLSLFDRSARRISLTAEGTRLAFAAADLIRIYKSTIEGLRLSSEMVPQLQFSVSRTLGAAIIPEAVAKFAQRHPETKVAVFDVDRPEAITLLFDRVLDFSLTNNAPRHANLERELVGRTFFAVAVSKDSRLGRQEAVTWKDLETTPLVLAGDLQRRGYLKAAWEAEGYDLKPAYEVNELTTGIGFAAAGLGFVLLPFIYLPRPVDPRLKLLRLESENMRQTVEMLYLKGTKLPVAAQEMVDIVREQIRVFEL